MLRDVWPFEEETRYGWTNLISTSRAFQDQGDNQLAFGLAITCDMALVGLHIRDKYGGFSEECVSADTACCGGGKLD